MPKLARRLFTSAYKSPYVRARARAVARSVSKRAYSSMRTYAGRRFTKRRRVTKSARSTFGETRTRALKQYSSTRATIDNTFVSKSIYIQPLINITEEFSANTITGRRGNTVYLKGIRLCFERKNTQGFPLYYNYAVVSLKHALDISRVEVDGDDQAVAGFFRAEGTDERAIAFTTKLDSIQYHCRPINTDVFRVHTHKRFLIPGAGATSPGPLTGADATNWEADPYGDKAFRNYRFSKQYIKINKTIRWTNDGAADGGTDILLNQMWLVEWCSVFGTNAQSSVALDAMNSKVEIVTLFQQQSV